MLKLNSNALATWCKEPAYWKRPWYWKSESEVAQSCLTLCDSMDCSPPGSSVHGILQARILEWVAISFSRGSSRPRDWTQVSHIAGIRFNLRATREALDTGKDWGQKEKGPVLESVLYGRAIVSVSGLRVTSKRADTTYHTSQDCCCSCPYSRPLLTPASAGDLHTLTGRSGSVSCGGHCSFAWVLARIRFCLCPPLCLPSPSSSLSLFTAEKGAQ